MGISPKGTTIFVSNLYTGAISYKEITRCSGILDLYEPDDSVMADKGFEIEDLLKEKNVTLNLPSFFCLEVNLSWQPTCLWVEFYPSFLLVS